MNMVRLGEVAEINPSLPSSIREDGSRSVSFVRMAQVTEQGQIESREERRIADVLKGYTYFEQGDVLFAKITPCMENGKAALVSEILPHHVGFGSTEFHVLRPSEKLWAPYLFYLVWNPLFRRAAEANMTGSAGQKRVPARFMQDCKIPLPPLPEQKRIAAILDKADAARRKRAQTLELADQFLKSAFLDMFGDPVTNPKGWPVSPLGRCLSFLTSGSRGWAKYYSRGGSLFLRIQNVGINRLNLDDAAYVRPPDTAEAKRTRVQAGDVLLSITADLGRTAVIPDGLPEAHINQHLALLRPRGINPYFLASFLSCDAGTGQMAALNRNGVKAGLNFDDIRSLWVVVPPLARQERYARLLERQQALLSTLASTEYETDIYFDSLVQRAFRGDL